MAFKFRRQQPIGSCIVDFVCIAKKLVIELDGGQHATGKLRDSARTRFLESRGFQVLRFWNNDVLANVEGIQTMILDTLAAQTQSPHPAR